LPSSRLAGNTSPLEPGEQHMFHRKATFGALTATPFLLVLAASAGLSPASQSAAVEEPAKADAKGGKQNKLLKERLAVVRQIAKLAADEYKAGTGSFDGVREANRMVLQAELERCDSDKGRVAVLEKFVAEARKLEEHAGRLSKTGMAPTRTALKAKADRLQAEIALERVKAKAGGRTGLERNDQVDLAANQVAIKRAAVKVAEAQKKIKVAKLASLRAQVAEAQASESYAEKQVKRLEVLLQSKAVTTGLVDEHRTRWEAAKARRKAVEGKVVEVEAEVLLEGARVELAQLEVKEAELRLKQLKVSSGKKR
jgi:hypothetical protein